MTQSPHIIEDNNLSIAWTRALELTLNQPTKEISPLIVSLTGFDELSSTREILDEHLEKNKYQTIQTVSETIFPASIRRLRPDNRTDFYKEYLKILPRLKKIHPANRKGTYFERMIAYNGDINQLENILISLQGTNKRRSKLQISIFDPRKDHTNGIFQGFPCLQHVTFYCSKNGGLILNSFYAIQYLYERAYGNWLGLINLGKFIANELGIEFERFNCFIGVEKFEANKKLGQQILNAIKDNKN